MWFALVIGVAGGVVLAQGNEQVIIVPLGPQNSPPPPDAGPPPAQPLMEPPSEETPPIAPTPPPPDAGTPEPVLTRSLPPPRDAGEEVSQKVVPPTELPDAGVPEEEKEVHAAIPVQPPVEEVDAGTPSLITLGGSFESDFGVMPSGFGTNGVDIVAGLRPTLSFAVKDIFSLELGPLFRIRVGDFAPFNRSRDVGQFLRGADWDEASDFGQIIQSLTIGHEGGIVSVDLSPKRKKTMGLGHLLWRYSNQVNADYHPTGGELELNAGPIHGEFFASDLFGARLFAAEVAWDIGGTFSKDAKVRDRYVLAISFAHDASKAGRPFRPDLNVAPFYPSNATLVHVDASAVLYRSAELSWMAFAGLGVRANDASDLGFVGGTSLDASVQEVGFSARLEVRKQAGGFRQGYFGPQYELQRFSDVGFRETGINDVRLPDSGSAFLELRAGIGDYLTFDAAAEYFFWQRLDLDGSLQVSLLRDWLFFTAHASVQGILVKPRTLVTGGFRWRIVASVYVMAEAGTVFMPQADGTLLRGVQANAGVGFDFQR